MLEEPVFVSLEWTFLIESYFSIKHKNFEFKILPEKFIVKKIMKGRFLLSGTRFVCEF